MNQYNTIIIKTHILLNKNGFSPKVMKLEGEIASFHDNKSLTIPGPPGVPDYFPLTPVTPPYEVRFHSVLGWSAIFIYPKLVNILKFLVPFAYISSQLYHHLSCDYLRNGIIYCKCIIWYYLSIKY